MTRTSPHIWNSPRCTSPWPPRSLASPQFLVLHDEDPATSLEFLVLLVAMAGTDGSLAASLDLPVLHVTVAAIAAANNGPYASLDFFVLHVAVAAVDAGLAALGKFLVLHVAVVAVTEEGFAAALEFHVARRSSWPTGLQTSRRCHTQARRTQLVHVVFPDKATTRQE